MYISIYTHVYIYPEALRATPPPRFIEPDDRILRSPRGPLGALGGPLGRPEAQGRSGVSERGSRGSWGCLGRVPGITQIITFGRWICYKNKCFVAWAIFDEMKGLSGFHCFLMVFSNVPSAEQGGEFIGNTSRNWRFASWTLIKNEEKTWSESWVWKVNFRVPKWRQSYKNQ